MLRPLLSTIRLVFFIFVACVIAIACRRHEPPVEDSIVAVQVDPALADSLYNDSLPTPPVLFPFLVGELEVQFPDTPSFHQQELVTEIGLLQLSQYLYTQGDTASWVVSYADYPKAMLRLGSKDRLLEGIQKNMLRQLNLRLQSSESFKFKKKHKGLLFSGQARKSDLEVMSKILLIEPRLYQFSIYRSVGGITAQDSLSFLEQFTQLDS